MAFKKITFGQYELFRVRYFKAPYQPLRFGQAFFNEFLKLEDEVENLYNIIDTARAQEIILANYVAY
jgi:hypothetical protein